MIKQLIKKIMLIGESGTGKTSLMNYLFNNRQFTENYYPTTGVEAGIKTKQFKQQGKFISVQIWDSAGKHQLHQYVCEKFYGEFDGFIVMIDLSREETLNSLNYWLQKIKRVRGGSKGYSVGVIANKKDIDAKKFSYKQFHEKYPKIQYYKQISLKQQDNNNGNTVQDIFYQFAKILYNSQLPDLVSKENQKSNQMCQCYLM